jgi:UDP-N-acetylmuramoyl-L-alanyl-D-glutamate--2,6-diaminopimelate ligase
MKLTSLLKGLHYLPTQPLEDAHITAVVTDSRKVIPGCLFIALKPLNGQDGRPYIYDAIEKGASYILKDQDVNLAETAFTKHPRQVVLIDVYNARLARTQIAATLYPHQPDKIVAVTGTTGKTSVVTFLRQLWEWGGIKAASLGTLGVQTTVPFTTVPEISLTSPDPFVLHQVLSSLKEHGVTHVSLEASSHGIDQYRLECLNLSAAAFTNLSHEHLDYHGTLENYFKAKQRLFSELLPEGSIAVLNADDFRFKSLYDTCRERGHRILSFGRDAHDIQLIDAAMTEQGQTLHLKIFGRHQTVVLPLIGLIQGYNVMAAIGLAIGCGMDEKHVLAALPHLKSVPGRFERIGQHPSGGTVYVDYAHKPHALEMVLTSLKPHVKGLLTVVFGCGGDRDSQKRSMMGEIAARHADIVIITDDNPRSEDPALIRRQIRSGCPDAIEIADRRTAIVQALQKLESHDVCIIAGKGHEQGQIVGETVIPFDDRTVVREELQKLGGILY